MLYRLFEIFAVIAALAQMLIWVAVTVFLAVLCVVLTAKYSHLLFWS